MLRREPAFSKSHAETKVRSIIDVFEPCSTFVEVVYPVRREFGDFTLVKGIRAQHGGGRDRMVCLGGWLRFGWFRSMVFFVAILLLGLRIRPDVNEDQVKALATLSTYKYACLGIDMAGSHGGIVIDPAVYTEEERKSILMKYALELVKINCCGELM